jgi:DNA-directed RNA polymerase subunit RPC12/RpoP
MKTYQCKNCGKESNISHQKLNIYCSNTCQKEWQSKERLRLWLEEGKDWKIQIPKWVKKYIASQRGYSCEVCGITEHNNKPIILECDHIDSNPTNNDLENLRLICPNCHSQTDSFKGKNRGNGRQDRYN